MKIESYAVNASSHREYLRVESATTLLTRKAVTPVAVSAPPQSAEEEPGSNRPVDVSGLIEAAKQQNERFMRKLQSMQRSSAPRMASDPQELKIRLLEEMIYALTGKRFRSKTIDFPQNQQRGINIASFSGNFDTGRQATVETIETQSFFYESESVTYNAQGVINTADGRSINIDLSLSMSRQFVSSSSISVEVQRCDPLVINYGGSAASLTGERFAFDLTCDGEAEMISRLGEGSGFLAWDKNGDGVINDGNELFGPQSGNGFEDLRAHDSDGNGWIDENDDIFSKLLVWSTDKDGNDQLVSLLSLDIGAIYLGDVATEFSLNGDDNENYGVVRSTSFFLKESGGAGTLSHIDMSL